MPKTSDKDSLFAAPLGHIEGFRFNQAVVDVFPDMLKRSVPGYETIITQSALLAARFAQPNTNLYDLGASLGATALSMQRALAQTQTEGCVIHAIDNSPEMVAECRRRVENTHNHSDGSKPEDNDKRPSEAPDSPSQNVSTNSDVLHTPIMVYEADLESHPLENASVVAMNFTLQFVDADARLALMCKIAQALRPGGVLILSEKVCFDESAIDRMHIDMYHAFKRANGYSELEISQKRTALENVLIPDTLNAHHQRLFEAGFSHSSVWFQYFNFASLIAIRH